MDGPSTELEEEAKVAEPELLIDCSDISVAKVATALRNLKNNKAAGICNIPADLLKYVAFLPLSGLHVSSRRCGKLVQYRRIGRMALCYRSVRAREAGINARITGESLCFLCLGKFSHKAWCLSAQRLWPACISLLSHNDEAMYL